MATLEPQNARAEHTGSYYAASVNHRTDYPVLEGEYDTDICVIGAGFSGVSTALHLAERGYRVTLVEANRVGWGASGRNGGQIIGGISGETRMAAAAGEGGEELLWELRWAGHDIIRERVATYGIDCDLKWGYLDVAIKPRHLRDQAEEAEYLAAHDYPHEVRSLGRDELVETIGTTEYIGALYNGGNGHLHPLNLCIGQARAAESLGATLFEQSPVTGITHGNRPRVNTERGSVTADTVVLAGNAYHQVTPKLRGRLFPVNSFIIATEPLPPDTVARINPHDWAICDPNFVLEYFRLSADKRLLFGGRFNYFGTEPSVIRRFMIPRMCRVYPELEGVAVDHAWGGTIGVTVNRVPQLGKLADNVFYMQGYSGHGVNVTHLAGQVMADAVAGTLERFDVFARVPPVVLPGAHTFRKAMVSLGMAWYQMKDRL